MKSVRSKAKPNKRDAILNAMLDVVVERGFHEAPMSLISERSGASAGVIYHHFASKEEIIQAVYERVRALKRASLLEGYSPDMDAKEAFIRVSVNAYRFYRKHLRELHVLDQYENAGFVCLPDKNSQPEPVAEPCVRDHENEPKLAIRRVARDRRAAQLEGRKARLLARTAEQAGFIGSGEHVAPGPIGQNAFAHEYRVEALHEPLQTSPPAGPVSGARFFKLERDQPR
jgi:AcrR family transcriptional regulator